MPQLRPLGIINYGDAHGTERRKSESNFFEKLLGRNLAKFSAILTSFLIGILMLLANFRPQHGRSEMVQRSGCGDFASPGVNLGV